MNIPFFSHFHFSQMNEAKATKYFVPKAKNQEKIWI
jgi:hypothetical protein